MGDMWESTWCWDNLSSLWDYTFDTKTWKLVSEGPPAKRADGTLAAAHGHDFPTIHPAFTGRKMRYVYVLANANCGRLEGPVSHQDYVGAAKVPGSDQPGAPAFYNSQEKYDLETGDVKEYNVGRASSDTVFVPKKNGQKEDEGYLLSVIYNDDKHTSNMLVVDAESMEAVCEIELPVHVTTTFHGCWVPDV